jgi:pyrroline-5-carboxylate reductase
MMNVLQRKQITVIGAGNIGRILLDRFTLNGLPAAQLLLCDVDADRAGKASRRFGPQVCSLTDDVLYTSDIFLLATPPNSVPEILKALSLRLQQGQLVVSFAAAISLSRLEALVPPGVSVARVMPNAPSMVGKGMNPVVYGTSISPEAKKLVSAILQSLGKTIEVRDEQMNWSVGLTGAAMRSLLPALQA